MRNQIKWYLVYFSVLLFATSCQSVDDKKVENNSPAIEETEFSKSCDSTIKPDQELGYRARGNRCEGFYKAKVSAENLSLVSFTKGALNFAKDAKELIYISANADVASVNLKALGIPMDLHYQMDAQFDANKELIWEANTVLLQNSKTTIPQNIGVLCSNGAAGQQAVFYPTQIRTEMKGQIGGNAQLTFMSSTKINQVQWKLSGQNEYNTLKNSKSFEARQPFVITLPEDLASGTFIFELKAKEYGKVNWITTRIRMFI